MCNNTKSYGRLEAIPQNVIEEFIVCYKKFNNKINKSNPLTLGLIIDFICSDPFNDFHHIYTNNFCIYIKDEDEDNEIIYVIPTLYHRLNYIEKKIKQYTKEKLEILEKLTEL